MKQGAVRKNWKQRWMVLRDDGCLYYYKNDKDLGRGQAPLGVINIKLHCLDVLCGDECYCQWPVSGERRVKRERERERERETGGGGRWGGRGGEKRKGKERGDTKRKLRGR